MVFLKRFHADGFKSFAKPLTLNFDSTMIGILGANGSGKSNIVDALRWVMGEQSNKALRGKEKSNMIFVGSNDMDPAEYAFVELLFDNSKRTLHCDYDDVKISRRLIRKTGETIYMLNDKPCLLKDIHNIFVDSGLGKGSLNLISQGSVNWFAEAKPEDRRKMFESAAGIGKYISQKEETHNLLEKASTNLERLDLIEKQLKRDINDLTRQAEKANIFREKKEKLKKYEISVSVQDYLTWKDEVKELNEKVNNNENEIAKIKIDVNKARELRDKYQQEFNKIDKVVQDLYDKQNKLNEEITQLSTKQTRYISNLENNLSSGTIEERIKSYQTLIVSEKENLASLKRQLEKSEKEFEEAQTKKEYFKAKISTINDQYNNINTEFTIKQQSLKNLEDQLRNNTSHERGVNELLKVKQRIPGINNTIANLITVSERYEIAIQTALGKSLNNLVVETQADGVQAIKYLKENNLGRATFLPLDCIKPKDVKPDSLLIMQKAPGFVDIASNLIKYDEKYKNAILSLLGNIGVANDIDNATKISKLIHSNYKIITLDGDAIYSGGAMSGGQLNTSKNAVFNLEEKIKKAKSEFEKISDELKEILVEKKTLETNNDLNESKYSSLSINLSTLKNQITDSNNKIERFNIELDVLSNDTKNAKDSKIVLEDFQRQLIELNEEKNSIDSELKESQKQKEIFSDNLSKFSSEFDELNSKESSITKVFFNDKNKLDNIMNKISNTEQQISNSYGLTMDNAIASYNEPLDITMSEARQIINKLKIEIDALGSINFDALESLDSKKQELESIEKEHNEAKESVNSLLKIINELDKRAKEDFMNVIRKVNEIIPNVFKNLFGGGNCQIKLSDESNVLESGIEVIAQPPGKKVTNLVLLSGGEKTLIALAVLFSLLKSSNFPLVLLDEAEAALDQANVNTFAKLIKEFSDSSQFLIITHRTGTMKMCDVLYGATMRIKGVTEIVKTSFESAKQHNKG